MKNMVSNIGHKASAAIQSQLYARNGLLVRHGAKLAVALVAGGAMMAADPAAANTFNTFASSVAGNTNNATKIINTMSYIGGTALAAFGVLDMKKHVENPSQTPMKNGLAKLGFGGLLLMLPYVSNTIADTMAGSNTQATQGQINVDFK